MVERVMHIFHREWGKLHEAAFLLAGFAILSQALGLVRDRLLTHQFGAGSELDVYYAAFRIPDLLYASIASFVAVTVLIPYILERMEDGDNGVARAKDFFDGVFTTFLFTIVLITGALWVLMPWLAQYVVPGFTPESQEEFVLLSRILLLSPVILGVSNLFGSITQTFRRFFVFALGPVLYNIGILFGIIFLLPVFGIAGVVWGVILGAALHMSIQLPVLIREGFVPRFSNKIKWKEIERVVTTSLPRTLALSSTHLVSLFLVAVASGIEVGAIAVFTLAMNLQSIPLSIVGASYSVAAFPTLARLWNEEKSKEFRDQIVNAMRHIMFWSFPAIALFIVLRAQIVRTILGSGAFDWTATRLTAAALALFALSVAAQSILLLLLRSYYAMGETRKPLKYSLFGAFLTVVSALLLMHYYESYPLIRYFVETLLRVDYIPGTVVLMLPLAYSLGVIVSVVLFLRDLSRRFPGVLLKMRTAAIHSFTVSVVMGFASYHGLQYFAQVFDLDTLLGVFLQGLLSGFGGIVVGIFLLRLMDNREQKEIWESLHHRFWKAKPIAAEQENL